MIDELFAAVPGGCWPGRCPDPPGCTYAVYLEDVEADGPDGINCIFTHNVMVELYEITHDDTTEAAVEAELDAHGIRYTKQEQYWLKEVQRYQTVYEFSYIEKRSV